MSHGSNYTPARGLIVVAVLGVLAAEIDPWARANPDIYIGRAQMVAFIAIVFMAVLHGAAGRLRSGPDRITGADVIRRVPAVMQLSAAYLLLLAILVVSAALRGVRLDEYIASPLVLYVSIAPLLLIHVWGRYKLSKTK